jgi:asparagine synthase (glutamine-hydrolysing)
MSGFGGIVEADGGMLDPRLLERMAERLSFRGPDATQTWTRRGAGFCFTLLRTGPSPQSPSQPCSVDGQLWLLGEVRLDGREDLRRKLERHGEEVAPDATDEELVLRAWRQWTEKSFEILAGDFSFVLWDAESKHLWCARDLLGARPFFYAFASGQFVFSNTLEAVRLSPTVSTNLDFPFIGDFLLQSWCPDPERTAFRDIRRLPAGHALHFENGEIKIRRYASLPIEEPLLLKRREEYIEQFRFHFEQAVRDRLPRGPAGIFMSGGLDSTSVAALANQVQADRGIHDSIRAYTVDYSPLFDDEEGSLASQAARHMGIPIDILRAASCVPFSKPDGLSNETPEPCAEPFFSLHVAHHEQVAERARVALSGDGGDDILTGRGWPHLVYLLRRGQIGTVAKAFGGYALQHRRLPPLRAGIRTRLRQWMARPDAELDYPGWLTPSFEREVHLRDRWRELHKPVRSEHPLHPSGYASLTGPYWPSVFEYEDAAWSGVAIETRSPFLDQRLLSFLLRVPPVPWCMEKELLRESMGVLLPDEIRSRPKAPLAGDPLLLQAERNGWRPALTGGACEQLGMFVNWRMLAATSSPAPGLSLWADLRPIALNAWLKSVENKNRIQYSRNGGN